MVRYACPLTPPEERKPLTEEVLDMVKIGSPDATFLEQLWHLWLRCSSVDFDFR
jgi:hypothetical protein